VILSSSRLVNFIQILLIVITPLGKQQIFTVFQFRKLFVCIYFADDDILPSATE